MSSRTAEHARQPSQRLLLKRFAMALGSYALAILLVLLAYALGLYQADGPALALNLLLLLLSQLVFLCLYLSGINQRLCDPSLTEAQVLVALAWLSLFLWHVPTARGALLGIYPLVMLFGAFQLRPWVFARCAALAWLLFAGMNGWDAYHLQLDSAPQALLQTAVLGVLLLWLSLFAVYVQDLRRRMMRRRSALLAHRDTLRGMMHQLEELAATDELTGLYNRRHFLQLAARVLRNLQPGQRLGLALIDLDHFKRINDQHGHAAGDRALQAFAAVARVCLRDHDILARYGGEEFVLLLPECDAERLTACCERLRLAFSQAEPLEQPVQGLSLSAGMALLGPGDDLDRALHAADQALYRAKHEGRNRCLAAWTAGHVD